MHRSWRAAFAALAWVVACALPGSGSQEVIPTASATPGKNAAAMPEDLETWQLEPGAAFCLATAIYFEARGEPLFGRLAVGRVIINRAESKAYPDTICGVVYQNADQSHRCQFSFACDGKAKPILEPTAWRDALHRADQLIECEIGCPANAYGQSALWTSTHFHADYVSPYWADHLKRIMAIGRHIFYLERRG